MIADDIHRAFVLLYDYCLVVVCSIVLLFQTDHLESTRRTYLHRGHRQRVNGAVVTCTCSLQGQVWSPHWG